MTAIAPALCWSCHSVVSAPQVTCSACGVLLPPWPLSPFALLGLPVSVHLNTDTLTAAYLKAIAPVHPDTAARRSKKEQLFAAQHAAAVNAAYQALSNLYQRALCCYTLAGGAPFPETSTDKQLLTHVLEQREALSEADTVAAIDSLVAASAKNKVAALDRIANALDNDEPEKAVTALLWLRYEEKFSGEAEQRRKKLLQGDMKL